MQSDSRSSGIAIGEGVRSGRQEPYIHAVEPWDGAIVGVGQARHRAERRIGCAAHEQGGGDHDPWGFTPELQQPEPSQQDTVCPPAELVPAFFGGFLWDDHRKALRRTGTGLLAKVRMTTAGQPYV